MVSLQDDNQVNTLGFFFSSSFALCHGARFPNLGFGPGGSAYIPFLITRGGGMILARLARQSWDFSSYYRDAGSVRNS
jgi:hypothetical protein